MTILSLICGVRWKKWHSRFTTWLRAMEKRKISKICVERQEHSETANLRQRPLTPTLVQYSIPLCAASFLPTMRICACKCKCRLPKVLDWFGCNFLGQCRKRKMPLVFDYRNNNNNNNNTSICKAHNVSIRAESEAPAVARWRGWLGGKLFSQIGKS